MLQLSSLLSASDLSEMMTSQIATHGLYARCFRGEMKTYAKTGLNWNFHFADFHMGSHVNVELRCLKERQTRGKGFWSVCER